MVVDNSKRMTILVFIHSSLFILHQKNMFDDGLKSSMDERYLFRNIAKTCLSLPVGWMNKLQEFYFLVFLSVCKAYTCSTYSILRLFEYYKYAYVDRGYSKNGE